MSRMKKNYKDNVVLGGGSVGPVGVEEEEEEVS